MMFIRSERLFLRPGWPEDWKELFSLINDQQVVRNLASAPWPYTAEDAQEFAQRPQENGLPHFLVTLPGTNGAKLVGSAGLGEHEGKAELGYWIAREHWGKGYATEAACAVLRLAAALGHRQVFASHFIDNPASGRVLEKVGFRPIGDALQRYSLGRSGEALSQRYVIDLQERVPCPPCDYTASPLSKAA